MATEIVVVILLAFAIIMKGKRKFRQHGISMLFAVALHIASIAAIMVPSLLAYFAGPDPVNFADNLVLVAMIHVSSGLLAALFGTWLVVSWHLQTDLVACFRKKPVMILTLGLWLFSVLLGVFLFLAIVQA